MGQTIVVITTDLELFCVNAAGFEEVLCKIALVEVALVFYKICLFYDRYHIYLVKHHNINFY